MRDAFIKTIEEIAAKDSNLILITGDLGFGVLDRFAKTFPAQYINAGIAEQNMTGVAVGMALSGKRVFTYSIANFPTLRCLEQIRNDACYHDANVKIVAVGGGFSYGALGVSHHATEDLAIMRSLPNISVFAPGDPVETVAAVHAIYKTQGTCYLRLGRGGGKSIHSKDSLVDVSRAIRIFPGKDVVVLTTGEILGNAVLARKVLADKGYDIELYSVPSIKPIDVEAIRWLASNFKLIVTVEEHSTIGGLGSAVAEVLCQMHNKTATQLLIGIEGFCSEVGDQDYLRQKCGLSVEGIVSKIIKGIQKNNFPL